MPRISLDLTPEQRDEADRIKLRLMAVVEDEIQGIAELLASKPDRQILGQAEFQVRDRVHSIGARAIETALDERKKGHSSLNTTTNRRPRDLDLRRIAANLLEFARQTHVSPPPMLARMEIHDPQAPISRRKI